MGVDRNSTEAFGIWIQFEDCVNTLIYSVIYTFKFVCRIMLELQPDLKDSWRSFSLLHLNFFLNVHVKNK